jgi:hypothetical protein
MMRFGAFPQGLKPHFIAMIRGVLRLRSGQASEAVPFQSKDKEYLSG